MRQFMNLQSQRAAATAMLGFMLPCLILPSLAAAAPSDGCASVNSGGFNISIPAGDQTDSSTMDFAAGDRLTITVTRVPGGDGAIFELRGDDDAAVLSSTGNTVSETLTYTVTPAVLRLYANFESLGAAIGATATCSAAEPVGPNDSQKLRGVQVQGTKIVAQTSGGAIAGAVDAAIEASLNTIPSGGGAPGGGIGAPAGLGGPAPSRPGRQPQADVAPASAAFAVERRGWTSWGDLRITQTNRRQDAGGFDGHQFNGTFGVGSILAPGVVVGLLGGYEHFGYDIRSLDGRLSGDGITGGVYLGWRVVPGLRFDLAGAYTSLDYDARAGTAAGAFEGRRKLLSTGLTGTTRVGDVVIEPSARLFAIWEHQGVWTDSLGTQQAENSFSAGRASAGLRVAKSWPAGDGLSITPYAGLYGDHHFSRGEGVPSGTEILAIGDGWSGRAVGGVTLDRRGGASLSAGGEWGGLGASHTQRSLTVRGALPF